MLFEKSMKYLVGGKLYDMIWYVICDDEYVDDYKYYKCFFIGGRSHYKWKLCWIFIKVFYFIITGLHTINKLYTSKM